MKTFIVFFILFACLILVAASEAFAVTRVEVSDPNLALTNIPLSMDTVNAIEQSSMMFDGEHATTLAPPARYNSPFVGEIRVIWVHPWNVRAICRNDSLSIMGCQLLEQSSKKVCTLALAAIDLDRNVTVESLQRMFIHERAHCKGWTIRHEMN